MSSAAGKRPRATPTTDGDEENKRLRSVIDESADEFVCAITCELPLEPVTAEDGKIYERAAIEDWLKGHDKSPSTNLPMGKKLIPALQVKNMIEKLVRSGAIKGEKAAAWKKKIAEQEEVARLRQKAEGGDLKAMRDLADCYGVGKNGLPKDNAQAFAWSKRGAHAGDPGCMHLLAQYHLWGLGGAVKHPGLAAHWFTVAAAEHGYGSAAAVLGFAFAPANTRQSDPSGTKLGDIGAGLALPEDVRLTTMWLRKALSCKEPIIAAEEVAECNAWLQAHAVD